MFSITDIEEFPPSNGIIVNKEREILCNLAKSDEEFKFRFNHSLPYMEGFNLNHHKMVMIGSFVCELIRYEDPTDMYFTPHTTIELRMVNTTERLAKTYITQLCKYLYAQWGNVIIIREKNYILLKNDNIIADQVIVYYTPFKSINDILETTPTSTETTPTSTETTSTQTETTLNKIDSYYCVWDGDHIYLNERSKLALGTNTNTLNEDDDYKSLILAFVRGMSILIPSGEIEDLEAIVKISGLKYKCHNILTATSITNKYTIPNDYTPLAITNYTDDLNIHEIQCI